MRPLISDREAQAAMQSQERPGAKPKATLVAGDSGGRGSLGLDITRNTTGRAEGLHVGNTVGLRWRSLQARAGPQPTEDQAGMTQERGHEVDITWPRTECDGAGQSPGDLALGPRPPLSCPLSSPLSYSPLISLAP